MLKSVTTTSYSDSGLTNGTTYYYEVTAVNTVGESSKSGELSATPQAPPVPSAPQNLSATAGNASVSLSWTAPTIGGPSFTYNVSRGTSANGETLLASGVAGPSFNDGGLTNGTTYYYKVTATNSIGTGSSSNEASATPKAPPVPSAPQNLSATAGNASVSLSWTAPTIGGPSFTYNVYRSTTSGTEALVKPGVTTTSYTDSGLSNGTTYFYKVTAVNSVGEGSQSGEASAMPQGAATVPGAPTLSAATSSTKGVLLTWSIPSNGGSPITSYRIYRGGSRITSSPSPSCTATTCTYTDTTTPTAGSTYTYQVAARNSVGTGPRSNQASAVAK